MRHFVNILLAILLAILIATFAGGFLLTTLGVAEAFHDPFKGIFTALCGCLLMGLSCMIVQDLHLMEWCQLQFHLLWRWLRQQSRIDALERDVEDLDSRLRNAIDEGLSHWENGAEMSRDYNVLEGQHIRLQEQHHLLQQEMENLNEDFKDANDELAFRKREAYCFLVSIKALREENDQLSKQLALLKLIDWADKTHARSARK